MGRPRPWQDSKKETSTRATVVWGSPPAATLTTLTEPIPHDLVDIEVGVDQS